MHQPLDRNAADTPYAWVRLALSLLASTIGGVGMWSVVVVLPAVQAEFGVARGEASLPYTLTMLGFGFGGFAMGTLADRYGVAVTSAIGAVALGLGYAGAAYAGSIWQFALIQGALIGFFGASATFAPLVADTSHWFVRRRGIAVAICASGNYLSGTLWPPVLQHFVESAGWRPTHVGIGLFCVATLLPLSLAFRRQPAEKHAPEPPPAPAEARPVSPALVQALLIVAGFACCVAMSMPQVHIVAYCGDLGFGAARGAEMLALMLGLGVVSRLVSGWISDRIGGLRTLLLGSVLQGIALLMFLPFKGLVSLYVVSGMFGLFQGGIVPAYALIVRQHFSPREAGARVGTVLMATLFGMALGGWMSGAVFDWTGSYRAAFINGLLWNLLNVSIVCFLLWRARKAMREGASA
ncbi:MAG: MFS transporter [Microvirga sp.]